MSHSPLRIALVSPHAFPPGDDVGHAVAAEAAWMVGDSPVDWEAGLAAGVRVAAIVRDPGLESSRERRLELGVRAYASVLDWAEAAL